MFSRKDYPLTMLMIGVCAANFIAYMLGFPSEDGWGYYSSDEIWNGAYWTYITSCFVHYDIIHIVFNVYWLYILGSTLEKEIGTFKLFWVVFVSAIVTSGCEFIVSEDTGIGISGVLFCYAGLMWGLRETYTVFKLILTKRLFFSFLIWMVLCLVMTAVEAISFGNVAHISGLILGLLLAKLFVPSRYRMAWAVPSALLVMISIVPLFWFPTSYLWICTKAYAAYEDEDYEKSVEWLTRAIKKDSQDAWPYHLRGFAYAELKQEELSRKDWNKAYELDPSIFEDEE